MSKCGNCGATLSCGCQRVTTADGKSACKNCINAYNQQLNKKPVTTPKKQNNNLAPGSVTVKYVGPGQQLDEL